MVTEKTREIVRAIVDAVNPLKVILFGSCARDEETPESDYDFCVLVSDEEKDLDLISGKAYCSIIRMERPPVDIIVENISFFEGRKTNSSTLEGAIAKEGVVLYVKEE